MATTSQSNAQHADTNANTPVEASEASLPDVFVEHAVNPDKPGTHQKAQGPLPQWDQQALDAAAMEAKVKAEKAHKAALFEVENKRTALMFQRDQLVKDSNFKNPISECQTPERKPYVSGLKDFIGVGAHVKVEGDLSIKGRACWGGTGFVCDITGEGVDLKYTVKYTCGPTEKDIDFRRVILDNAFSHPRRLSRPSRKRKAVQRLHETWKEQKLKKAKIVPHSTIISKLREGHKENRKKGWRRRDIELAITNKLKKAPKGNLTKEEEQLFYEDWKELVVFKETNAELTGETHLSRSRNKNGTFKRSRNKYNPETVAYLQHAWGVGKNFAATLKKKRAVAVQQFLVQHFVQKIVPSPSTTRAGPQATIITDLELAKWHFTPKRFFINNQIKRVRRECFDSLDEQETTRLKEEFKEVWNTLTEGEKDEWAQICKSMIAKQPNIAGQLVDALLNDPTLSWNQLAEIIDDWCSASTIQRFITSHPSYNTYSERLLPKLSNAQRKKHVAFAKRVRSLWGQKKGKFLWIHYDEKWFWGYVARHAKMCAELGITRQQKSAYHRNHINKIMAICIAGFAFEDSPDNGGIGVKLGFTRAQAAKIAKRTQREFSGISKDGNRQFKGKILRQPGDAYMVDVPVTGSNDGTADNPKFSLLRWFNELIFANIAELVDGPDAPFQGYIPVIQGDNAGPHIEGTFMKCMEEYCNERGWLWEPQAPQMPHLNVNDLAIFPAMSKWHSYKVRQRTKDVASKDLTWECANQVWQEFPESKIAKAFVLAWRLTTTIIKKGGDNTFLGTKEMHRGISSDFHETMNGLKPK